MKSPLVLPWSARFHSLSSPGGSGSSPVTHPIWVTIWESSVLYPPSDNPTESTRLYSDPSLTETEDQSVQIAENLFLFLWSVKFRLSHYWTCPSVCSGAQTHVLTLCSGVPLDKQRELARKGSVKTSTAVGSPVNQQPKKNNVMARTR